MTTSLPGPLRPLIVLDHRSAFATVALAWRTRQQPNEAASESQLRAALDRAGRARSVRLRPVQSTWSNTSGAARLIVSLPEDGFQPWGDNVIQELHSRPESFSMPAIAAVGSERVAESTQALAGDLPSNDLKISPVPSSMRQTRQQGFEQTVITGADPSPHAGYAATFVALCALLAGPNLNLQIALNRAGNPSTVSISRTLDRGSPSIVWTVISKAEQSLHTLELVLEIACDLARNAIAGPAPVTSFAQANVNRPWTSPRDVAQAMVEYEVMGWGGHLIREPDTALQNVESGLRRAFEGLLMPVADVLGKPISL
ncbi:hypothetical protein GCM10027403_17380 [Arthrobacter tecti]